MAIGGLVLRLRALAFALWARSSRRIRVVGAMVVFFIFVLYLSGPVSRKLDVTVPKVRFDYHKNHSPFNETKVALLIENRPDPILAPLMLHFISVVPPDWRFRFMGSIESVEWINRSVAIQEQVSAGKLDLTYIPSNMTTGSQEEISRFLTTLWLYETVLQPAEHLLIFQTDSILCANSRKNLNDFLDYDWIGAPWNPEGGFGGNGGLSIRRVSAMIQVLREQKRVDGTEPEDVWLADRLGHRPGAKMANGTLSLTFSGEIWSGKGTEVTDGKSKGYNSTYTAALDGEFVEGIDDWRKGFYEPMGYHTGASGATTHGPIWGTPEKRKHIWDYCPEVKMTLKMDAAKYIPGDCGSHWKRDGELDSVVSDVDMGWGTEIIDGQEYPLLPPNLMPW